MKNSENIPVILDGERIGTAGNVRQDASGNTVCDITLGKDVILPGVGEVCLSSNAPVSDRERKDV